MRFLLLLLCVSTACLWSAEKKPKAMRDGWAEDPISRNGEMERPEATKQAWSAQEAANATDEAPVFTGLYMWRGRADRQYKPFHQWELRVKGGKKQVKDLKIRIIPLGADFEPMLGKKGHWANIGKLKSGKQVNYSYKLNCSAPSAIQVEATWDGGEAYYMSSDHTSLPGRYDPEAEKAQVVVLPPDFQYIKKRKQGGVVFTVMNKGTKPATGVKHTILLKDKKGNIAHTVSKSPTEDGVLPSGYEGQVKVVIDDCPPFKSVAITTSTAEDAAESWDAGEFTGIADVEVAHVYVKDGKVTADVRNGLPNAVNGLVITILLLDAQGGQMKSIDIPVGKLEPGAEQAISAPVAAQNGIAGWGVAVAFGEEGGDSQAAAAQTEIQPIVVEGVELAIRRVQSIAGGVQVDVTITNQREADLKNLTADVGLQDSAGVQMVIPVALDSLPTGTGFDAGLVAEGLKDVQGIQLQWKTGKAKK